MMPKPKNDQFLSLLRLRDDAAESELDALYEQMWADEAQERNARWA